MCPFLTVSHDREGYFEDNLLDARALTSPVRTLLAFYTGRKLNVGIIWFTGLFYLASNQSGKHTFYY